ncbi:gliding motility lipoprotein GldB [Robertkochia solimangrovi]|uniref:gliding motility lipoprotein GldB n=1 Tax=Robertkochia solimangrovi TaxID=2213046 RepID=UPI00117EC6F1|nr:gliding motility lipoprotein GldB [Robertkochia solimangrovi]TRZ44368.1 gliding motility lipoprotein GldB [Robertkochia solimangrovi]
MKKIFGILFVIFLISCGKSDQTEREIAKIKVNLDVRRFDLAFASATRTDLPVLKEKFPYLFPAQFPDSVWYHRMEDTLQKELFSEVRKKFTGFGSFKTEMTDLFKHVKYYFPELTVPNVVTITSDVDFRNRVIYADSLMLIALDNYLGKDHRFYEGIQDYIRADFEPENIVVDVAGEVSTREVPLPSDHSFLARMVYFGKKLYLDHLFLPQYPKHTIMHYSEEQYDWAEVNEEEIWRYFVERDLLFSTDSKLRERFIDPAPFSKFYLELDNQSPGRLGRFIGWQIVTSFMENNEVSLREMLDMPAQDLFNKSRYKPKK